MLKQVGYIKIVKRFCLLFLLLVISEVCSAQEYQTCIAQSGDGVYSLLGRYGYNHSYFKAFLNLNQGKFGKNNSLLLDQVYLLPLRDKIDPKGGKVGDVLRYNIFGKKYRDVKVKDEKLSGAVFYIVSGHGGPDPGAVSKYGKHTLCEDEYAYDVSLRLARRLIEHGALVYLIVRDADDGIRDVSYLQPDKDELCYPELEIPKSQNSRLYQRSQAVNKLYKAHKGAYQRMIVIHVDSRSKGQNIDTFFYYYKRSSRGKKTATQLQNTFKQNYKKHQPGRGYHGTVSARNLYVLRNTSPAAVFIELGNINHKKDQQRFIKVNNRIALAKWLSQGLIKDYTSKK